MIARFFKNVLLGVVVVIVLPLWVFEKTVCGLAGRPRMLTGSNPPGANLVLKWAARILTWLPEKARTWLGQHYVQVQHPRAWRRFRGLFQ